MTANHPGLARGPPALGACLGQRRTRFSEPNVQRNHGLVRQWQGRKAQCNLERRSLKVLGSQGRILLLFRCGRGRRRGNRRLKVRRAEKALRAELCQELGGSPFLESSPSQSQRSEKIDYFNQRRVLAEKQKPMLAQAAAQAAEARRS